MFPKRGTPKYYEWLLTPEYKQHCLRSSNGNKGSKVNKGRILSEEHKNKIGNANRGKIHTEESRNKFSISHIGKKQSEDTRAKISAAHIGRKRPENVRRKISDSKMGHIVSLETRNKLSDINLGEKSSNWKGGISFEPYCSKFNEKFKERVRKFFNYTCQICDHIWQSNEKKLSVHHVNYNKMVCCDGVKPLFVPLCSGKCHSKTNHNRKYWENIFTQKLMIEHDGECWSE